jgi:hypothetical protein
MAELFNSGRIVDLVLGLMLIEAVVLLVWHRTPGRYRAWLGTLTAGACLLLALRAAMTDAGWLWIALALSAAGIAHTADLLLRRNA